MDNIEFNAYLTDVFRLVRTMVIKIEAIADRDNGVLEAAGYPVGLDKRTWRYYLNLNGEYHPTDEIMKIISIDTGDEIVFNKPNMLIHLATFREYTRGGYWYNRLVEKYPGQTELIKGILAPIPLEETIEAEDYKILQYNKDLVLWNEDQLIPQLQEWINSQVEQLFNHEYRWTDNLMLPVGIMQLYADLIKAVCVIRHEAIGTRYAHEFYIWSHIDSHGEFSKYKASLDKFQIMWLYRNIAWLKQNPGQQYTLNKLMDNLLTHADIPLAKYDMVENTEDQLTELTPTPLYRKLQLNLLDDYGRTAAFVDTLVMTNKQQQLAKENFDQTAIWYDDALMKGKYSLQSELPTKALESKMSDYTNRHLDTKMSTTFNNWIYLAAKGFYKGKILVTDPKTGKQYRLPVGDAYYVWRFLVDLSRGQQQVNICPAYYHNVLKVKPPTAAELYDIAGRQYLKPPVLAYDIRAQWIPCQIFVAPEYLMTYSEEVYAIMWRHKKMYSQFYDLNKRARVKAACDYMYESGIAELTDAVQYEQLLGRYELHVRDYTPEEARNFAWEIFKRITGWDSSSNPSLRIKQDQLISIMMSLSSYTIHVIKEMDDGQDTTELVNETFVGDPRLVNGGNGSFLDATKISFEVASNFDTIHHLEALIPLPEPITPTAFGEAEGFATFPAQDVFKTVDLHDDLRYYAVRLEDNSYIRQVDGDLKEIGETNYDRLEYPDLDEVIPPTFYDRLVYELIQDEPIIIPPGYYQRLYYKANQT